MRPYVILNSAMSLDGRIGKEHEQIVFSDKLDNDRLNALRSSVDAVLIGAETILSDNPHIPPRDMLKTKPAIVIVDKDVETPPTAEILKTEAPIIIATSKFALKYNIEQLQKANPNIEFIACGQSVINLKDLLWQLHEMGVKKILLEGGRKLSRRMLDEDLVDEIYLTIAPVLIGEGLSFVHGKLENQIKLTLEGILQYGDEVVLHYLVKKSV